MNRDELIAALEKAEGPSRELDAHLSLILNDGWQYHAPGFIWQPGCGSINSQRLPVRRYTESIDAALTLVGGAGWTAEFVDDDDEYRVSVWDGDRWRNGHSRHSAAIALCIAALKARGGA